MPIREQQTTNKQHAVPQNIMDVEFKLIGDLTMRQFIYIVIFSLLAYLFKNAVPQPFTWPISLGTAIFGLILAFVPVEERGLDEWLVNFVQAINSPTLRVWRKDIRLPEAFSYKQQISIVQKELITLAPTTSRRKLEEFLQTGLREKEDDPLDIPEEKFIDMVKVAYATETVQDTLDKPSEPEVQVQNVAEPKIAEVQSEVVQPFVPTRDMVEMREPHQEEIDTPQPQKERAEQQNQTAQTEKKPKTPKELHTEPKKKARVISNDRVAKIIKARMRRAQIELPSEPTKKRKAKLRPLEAHAGRKFVNLTPSQGEIILPIRGEKVITPETITAEEKEQEERLNKLLGITQARKQKEIQESPAPKTRVKEAQIKRNEETPKEEKKRTQRKQETNREEEKPKKEKVPQQKKQETKGAPATEENIIKSGERVTKGTAKEEKYSRQIQALVQKPNVIAGVVKDKDGKLLENIVLTIKNDKGETVRAVRTNRLGNFAISAPLPNGKYTLEVDTAHKTNLRFDIISFETSGKVLPAIELIGH